MRVNRKARIVAGALWLAALSGPAGLWAKGPTFKEKVVALAAAGKTIPVVYLATEFEVVSVMPPSIMENTIFKAPAPAECAALGDEVVKALNAGFGVGTKRNPRTCRSRNGAKYGCQSGINGHFPQSMLSPASCAFLYSSDQFLLDDEAT